MFRTVWEPPFTHAYPLQASLAECGIPASNIGLSIPPDGWYWDRTKTERYEVSGSRMPAMNDARWHVYTCSRQEWGDGCMRPWRPGRYLSRVVPAVKYVRMAQGEYRDKVGEGTQ